LVRKSKEQWLKEFRRGKRNRTLGEVQDLLIAFGFVYRPGSKEHGGVWQRGPFTLTLPRPHGGDSALAPRYISLVLNMIELAETQDSDEDEEADG
jgi:hypothetical protein